MAKTAEEIAQDIALACLHDNKILAALRDDWQNDKKIASIGRKAGIFYKAIYKEVVEAQRCATRRPEPQLQDLPLLQVKLENGQNGTNHTNHTGPNGQR